MTEWSQDIPISTDASTIKRAKTALLAVICSAAAVLCPIGTVSVRADTAALKSNAEQQEMHTAGPAGQNGQPTADGSQTADGQPTTDGSQTADGQPTADGSQDTGGQNREDESPDGGQQEETGPGESSPDENIPVQDTEKKTIKVTASAALSKSGKYARISWKKTGDGEVSSWMVQRSSSRDGSYRAVSRQKSGTSYTDRTVKGANRYYYRVAAKTAGGDVYYSSPCLFQCPLEPLPGVKLVRYSTSSIKVVWDKSSNSKAAWYKVYYSESKAGKYKLAGVTKNSWFRVRNLKNSQDYYFGVKACTARGTSGFDSPLSKTAKMRTMPYNRTTVYAGDSITAGLAAYNVLDEIAIGGKKSVVAAVGLNTTTFRTRKVFNGKSGTESIVAAKPYRVYIMLGDNDIHYRNKNDLIDGYREIVRTIRAGSPDTDIVILAASPVTAAEVARRRGFAQIPAYNQALSVLAAEMGVRYYDCTGFLKDSAGWLKSSYNAGDGVHWKSAAYHEYAKQLAAYDKSLD